MTETPRRALRPVPNPSETTAVLDDVDASRPAARKAKLQPGEMVPGTNYRLLKWLGEGGMGTVYLAENVQIDRQVAIKSLHPRLVRKKKLADVFRREARASARIGAPNIIEVIDFHELQDGRLLYVMEFLDGVPLQRFVDEAPMSPERLIPILRQVCKGLHAAHQAGIVHRDIKPDNIMLVQREKQRDFVKVVDFGIAALLSEGDENRPRAGTPTYIAPEQIRRGRFDGRADMYSLGCTAYEILTGKPPFETDTIRGLLQMHLEEVPVPPSELVGSEHVPQHLEAVIMRCLEKHPDDRFAHMADLEAAICEAQIADGVMTAWDELPLPDDIDAERRSRILSDMPHDRLAKRRRAWLVPALVAGAVVVGSVTTYLLIGGDDPLITEQASEIQRLTNSARAAAGRALWVIPALDDPEAKTALDFIRELESRGDEASLARAAELRAEFAEALVRQGDRYVDQPGGKPFAYEFYAQAIAFEPDNERARSVGGFSAPVAALIIAEAEAREFSREQLERAEITRALAQDDPELRRKALAAAAKANAGKLPLSTNSALDTIMRGLGSSPPAADAAGSDTQAEGDVGDEGETDAADAVDDEGLVEDDEGAAEDDTGQDDGGAAASPSRNKSVARKLAGEAKQAAKRGDAAQAERLYHKALSADRYNVDALAGLGDVYYNRGNYSQSVTYRKRAVRVSTRRASLRIALGDAYFKVLRYKDALREYKEAKKLGSSAADARIKKVEARL